MVQFFLKIVYGAGISTHDLPNVSLLQLPLDQGSRPSKSFLDAGVYLINQLKVPFTILDIPTLTAFVIS